MANVTKFPESFIKPGLTILLDRAYFEKSEEAKSEKESETESPE